MASSRFVALLAAAALLLVVFAAAVADANAVNRVPRRIIRRPRPVIQHHVREVRPTVFASETRVADPDPFSVEEEEELEASFEEETLGDAEFAKKGTGSGRKVVRPMSARPPTRPARTTAFMANIDEVEDENEDVEFAAHHKIEIRNTGRHKGNRASRPTTTTRRRQ
eukprot:TRINITY_DN8808_c0_g1_i1.p3 TRINITY_DN8808_c0_g1~~TRINITY_DN8808_c0_g1_i1.p3  ORF type:complete len:167 (-),score=50.17 TRINITY_DN8808_c0_g1_i1:112-612(-)